MTTVGYGDVTPASPLEHVYAILIMLIGHCLFAFIFGLMATLVANLDYTSTVFRMKIDALRRFMEYRQIPPFLMKRIDRYYDYQVRLAVPCPYA
jgi:hypothetical protein